MSSCAACTREIHVGDDCYQVARGVLGTRDFINLEAKLFCGEECLDAQIATTQPEPTPSIPRKRRVP